MSSNDSPHFGLLIGFIVGVSLCLLIVVIGVILFRRKATRSTSAEKSFDLNDIISEAAREASHSETVGHADTLHHERPSTFSVGGAQPVGPEDSKWENPSSSSSDEVVYVNTQTLLGTETSS